MSVYIVNDTDLISVADAIRSKSESTEELVFPDGFISAIPNGIPKATKIKYIIPATLTPPRTSDDNGFDSMSFTFTRENVNQLLFADFRLQDEINFNTNGFWIQDIGWHLYYQGNYLSQHNLLITWTGAGNKGNGGGSKVYNVAKTALTANISVSNHTTTDVNYKRHGTTYKGLIFIYDSTYDGAPIVDETKLTQFFTCDYLTEGM